MASLSFVFVSAAPAGNGFQKVSTNGSVDAILDVRGNFVKITCRKDDVKFANKAREPVPLSPNGIGQLTVKNQYGYINYEVSYCVLDIVDESIIVWMRAVQVGQALQGIRTVKPISRPPGL